MSAYEHIPAEEGVVEKRKAAYLPESIAQRHPIINHNHVQFCATWRGTALIGAGIAGSAFILNLGVLIWALTFPLSNGFAPVYIGGSDETQQLDIISKLLINIISTAILISSSRCTQFLCSPTRAEVDDAHRRGTWLDVGIRSWRNFKAINRWRKWMVIVLFMSSIPIHLIYNSTVLATRAARDFVAVTVDPSFVQGVPANQQQLPGMNETTETYLYGIARDLQNNKSGLFNATPSECQTLYENQFQSQFGNLLLSIVAGFQLGTAAQPGQPGNYDWWQDIIAFPRLNPSDYGALLYAIAADCSLSSSISCATNGNFSSALVDYCLVEQTVQKSVFSINIGFLVVVMFANAVKALSLLWAGRKQFTPLITTGDAVASLLADPDEHTAQLGPLSVLDIQKGVVPQSVTFSKPKKPLRWFKGPTKSRWVLGTVTLLVPLCIGVFVMLWNLPSDSLSPNDPDLVRVTGGFLGQIFSPAMITFGHSFVVMALVVNSPQILLTLVYLCINNLLTNMALVNEYHSYVVKRKALRVTKEEGGQRTTYFLSLPNKYALPLIIVWTAIHWLISESLTLMRVNVLNPAGQEQDAYTAILVDGEWCLGFMCATLALALTLVLLGIRKLESGMPLARTCSLALSAICHRSPKDQADIALKPLQFGVIPGVVSNELQCIGFSENPVDPVEAEVSYTSCGTAGISMVAPGGYKYPSYGSESTLDAYEHSMAGLRRGEAYEMIPHAG